MYELPYGWRPNVVETHEYDPTRFYFFRVLPQWLVREFPTISRLSSEKLVFRDIFGEHTYYSWNRLPKLYSHTLGYRLQRAICEGDIEETHRCIKAGVDLNAPLGHFTQHSPLTLAVLFSRSAILQLLLLSGADPNRPVGKYLPLTYCALHHKLELLQILLNAGAEVTARERSGHSVLEAARLYCDPQLAVLLGSMKANLPRLGLNFKFAKQLKDDWMELLRGVQGEGAFDIGNDLSGSYRMKLWCWSM